MEPLGVGQDLPERPEERESGGQRGETPFIYHAGPGARLIAGSRINGTY